MMNAGVALKPIRFGKPIFSALESWDLVNWPIVSSFSASHFLIASVET
jgi:hypothetical protein